MERKRAASVYIQTAITTASSAEMAILLLEEALKCIKRSRLAMEKGLRFEQNELLKKAQQCVNEIIPYLNEETKQGQAVAAVYQQVNQLLIKANVYQHVEHLNEAEEVLVELVKAWQANKKK